MEKPLIRTLDQISAGGAAFRTDGDRIEIALISVAPTMRWQLPKGLIDPGETPEQAAIREVREEAGIETELVEKIETVEYWFYASRAGERVRYHKFVHFFLLKYVSGDVADHDHEVDEARWVPINEAIRMLAFDGEKNVAIKAREMLAGYRILDF